MKHVASLAAATALAFASGTATAQPIDAQVTPNGLRWIIQTFEPDKKAVFKARVRMKK